jgi:hypothetical protein
MSRVCHIPSLVRSLRRPLSATQSTRWSPHMPMATVGERLPPRPCVAGVAGAVIKAKFPGKIHPLCHEYCSM